MLVLCDNCNSKYKITIKKNPGKPITFKCGKCSSLIRITVDQIAAQIGGPPPSTHPGAEARVKAETVKVACLKCGNTFIKPANEKSPICYQCRIDALVSKVKDKYGVAAPAPEPATQESRYTIRSADGLVLGPIKLRTVAVLARERRIKGVEEVSKDGADYVPLMKFPELAEFFPDMKEIMDTTGLEDKVEAAFMAAFGGEEIEEPETPAPPKETEAGEAETAPAAEPPLPEPQPEHEPQAAAEPATPSPEPGPDAPPPEPGPQAEPQEPEQKPVAETPAAPAPAEETSAPQESPTPEEPAAPEAAATPEPAPAPPSPSAHDDDEDEVIDWGTTKKEETPAEAAEAPAAGPAAAEPAPPSPAPEAEGAAAEEVGTEFKMEGEEQEEEEEIIEDLVPVKEPTADTRYRIRYPDGLILGPVKLGTVKELFNTGNLTGQEEVQRENEPWAGFAELPELAELVTESDVIPEEGVIELTDALEEQR